LTKIPHIRLRGSVWTWRRRLPSLSTKIEHVQLSLGTKCRVDARILANRLNYEFDKVTAAMQTGLTYDESKVFLTKVRQDETRKIKERRLATRLDTGRGEGRVAVLEDWAKAHAWGILARDGLDAQITGKIAKEYLAQGHREADVDLLADTLYLSADDLRTEDATSRMLREAEELFEETDLKKPDHDARFSDLSVLQLRQLLISAKAIAWAKAEQLKALSEEEVLDSLCLLAEEPVPPPAPQVAAQQQPAPSEPAPIKAVVPDMFTTDPAITAVAERVNSEKNRKGMTDETQKQIISTAHLLIKSTGITSICDLEQRHMKYFMNVLDGIPKSYGKSSADATRSIEEILARGEDLPPEKVGLAPRTQNGHLDRISLMVRLARSEGLRVPDIDFGLLRVPETERLRDKRVSFTLEQATKLFDHPIWTGCNSVKRRHIPGPMIIKDAQYFGPLLGAYTGARREELLGLTPDDVRLIDGIPCIDIRPNQHRGLKNPAATRIVPIHDHLLELGFMDHVDKMQKAKQVALFPELIPATSGQKFGDNLYYNWHKALHQQLGAEAEELCFHSWRHYVIATLKEDSSVTDKHRRDLAGHVGKDVHEEVYDKATSPTVLRKVVNLLPRMF
jgi:integrase